MTVNRTNEILDDIQFLMKNAVIIVPRLYTFLGPLDFETGPLDIFHLQKNDIEYMIDKADEMGAQYRNIYIVPETHPVFAYFAGTHASADDEANTAFECNSYYLIFDPESRQYIPYKLNEID
jgi:hypothetical protein